MLLKSLAAVVAALAAMLLQPDTVFATKDGEVYVVRHLQKAAGDDPPLSAEGALNAQRLAHLLSGSGIRAIFATDTRRARETAVPLARRLRIPINSYDPRKPELLVQAAAAAGGPVLVVGHSNTVPDLVKRFGGSAPAALQDGDYGTVWIVSPTSRVTRTLSVLPTPAR